MTNTDDKTIPPEGAAEFGWAWVENVTGLEEIVGASPRSPAHAWAVGILTSRASTVEDLKAAEALRESGEMELQPASRALCAAWAMLGRRVEWKSHDGVAVTLDEYERLTAGDANPAATD